jgi:hypothetical protein
MANPEHLAKLRDGVKAWNEWRNTTNDRPDLSFGDLAGMDLGGYNLVGADPTHADLLGTDFHIAQLNHATLHGALLAYALFQHTDLTDTDVTDALIGSAIFASVNLSKIRGMEAIRFNGPSTIGIDTLFLSGGLPEPFLRGCGLPEELIAYANSLVGKPIEYYSCFLSYSSKDLAFARRLYDSLQGEGIRT